MKNKFYGSDTLHQEGQILARRLERLAELVKDGREEAITKGEVEDLERAFKNISFELEAWKKYVIDHCSRQLPENEK